MKLTSGYHFFQDGGQTPGCGFVHLRVFKNMIKIQCVAEHLPVSCPQVLVLCLRDSLNMEGPFILGKMQLRQSDNQLRGEINFTVREVSGATWRKYNFFALSDNQGEIILQTLPQISESTFKQAERPPFDPFNTTNPAYRWDRAESAEELKQKLLQNKLTPLPEISAEIKEALTKYRHILLGSYNPNDRLYHIIGVPGDRPPAMENSIYRWINKVVSLEEYPFFDGYKLYYFDSKSSAVVKAVLRTQPAGQQR